MDRRLGAARAVATPAAAALVPTAALASFARLFVAAAVLETALLATATLYAVYFGRYRYPRA
jgi:hypothetical protein